jgi:hypothetical protein
MIFEIKNSVPHSTNNNITWVANSMCIGSDNFTYYATQYLHGDLSYDSHLGYGFSFGIQSYSSGFIDGVGGEHFNITNN